jgi:predicted ATPase
MELAAQGLELATREHDPALEFLGEQQVAMLSVFLGRFVDAQKHLRKAMEISSRLPPLSRLSLGRTVADERVHCMNVAARNYWFLGYPDQALRLNREVLAAARLRSPVVHNFALSWITMLQLELRDWPTALELCEEYITSGIRHELSYTLAEATVLRGVAKVHFGRVEEGILEVQSGIEAAQGTGATRVEGFLFLADCYATAGQAAEGFAALGRAEPLRGTGLGSEFLRIKGELFLAQKPADEIAAEGCLREAIEIAQHQSAKSPELRAALPLARLLATKGKRDEARVMLGSIYNWFTEGFDTADLKEAKVLLDELKS